MGIVVLKRLADAIADGDNIYAVIKGTAINNDGSGKVGYTAPSVNGQAEVVAEALALADAEPETISYIEAHGTGTALGDPIEIAALTKVFRASTEKKGFCAIGSVKTNIGHLDAAAGVAGLIKTVLALQYKLIPQSLNFEQPNPQIDFANSPFYVNTKLKEWKTTHLPRRAGVSSLGIGGTNAHVILEEAPNLPESSPSRPWQLLLLSAKTDSALQIATENLAKHLVQHPDLKLADVAYTLQVGRSSFNHRRMVVCQNIQDAIGVLESQEPKRVVTHFEEPIERFITFMFSGQGSQYVDMARELYQTESVFREVVDNCSLILTPHLGLDLRSVLYPQESEKEVAAEKLQQTSIAQPALFAIEYALAQLLMSWGISGQAMIGHSIGEYVAACIAGVMSLEDALALVATRGRLMQQMPTGAMLSIPLSEAEVKTLLNEQLSLAANNAPSLCVVSGTHDAINALQEQLAARGIECRRLHTSHAFHSQMMEPVLEPFIKVVKKIKLNSPKIPFISNITGTWITTEQATDAYYWAQHLRQPVQFSAGISTLLQEPNRILLEVGPGRTLCTLIKQHTHQSAGQVVLPSLRHPQEQNSDIAYLLDTLGKLWLAGVPINWSGFYTGEERHRVPLPTYPFERQRYWIEPEKPVQLLTKVENQLGRKSNIANWFYIPSWKRIPLTKAREIKLGFYLIFVDECGIGSQLVKQLQEAGQDVIAVILGKKFQQIDGNSYTINPSKFNDYKDLFRKIQETGRSIANIIHLWSLTNTTSLSLETIQNYGYWSLIYLAQAFEKHNINGVTQILIVSNHLYNVTGVEELCPAKATILGPCKVIPQEYPWLQCRHVDVLLTPDTKDLATKILAELTVDSEESIIAYRNNHRWVQIFEPITLEKPVHSKTRLRQKGVYLITGGTGGIGLEIAKYLAQTVEARLILVGRSELPAKEHWKQWQASHDTSDETHLKIRKLQELESLGSKVLVLSADVTHDKQMQQVVAQSLECFGEINGVIHAAGVADIDMIQSKSWDINQKVFAPKIKGTLVLSDVLKGVNLDFLVFTSSLSSILGGLGDVDYCAANAFLDEFAHFNNSKSSPFTISVNWDAWKEVGMAVAPTIPYEVKKLRQETIENGILSEEGVDAFSRVLESSLAQILVSTRDVQELIGKSQQSISGNLQTEQSKHQRYLDSNSYVAPRNEVEDIIADIWQDLISIEKVGIYDNFFELGGHSLLAIQIISRLREIFHIELSLRTLLFDAPTIAELATVISQNELRFEEIEDIDKVLTEIENLSPDEIQATLVKEA
ncbi:hypothetical protein NUACC21_24820 [Scytonema sp. NUACC21]